MTALAVDRAGWRTATWNPAHFRHMHRPGVQRHRAPGIWSRLWGYALGRPSAIPRTRWEDKVARLDLGGLVLELVARVPGMEPPQFIWCFGVPVHTTPADRAQAGPRPTYNPAPKGVDWEMDLQDDKKILAKLKAKGEMGHPADFAGTYTWSTDRPDIAVVATDNGDGSAWIAATGVLDNDAPTPVVVTVEATRDSDSKVFTGTGLLTVKPGDAETFELDFDPDSVTEVTPDVTPPPAP